MKIPFDSKYKPQIESGKYKVETRDGRPARIICWDANCYTPIVFLATEHDDLDDKDKEYPYSCNNFGRSFSVDSPSDLFIVTPEPELSEFEKAVGLEIFDEPFEERHIKVIKEESAQLLYLARDQFIKDGYVIEKKTFHDAVEKVAPEVMKEVSENIDAINEALRLEYEKGKAEALKDLPTWRTIEEATTKRTDENDCVTTETMLVKGCMNRNDYRIIGPECMVNRKMLCIPVVELSKLPGFKEDEK